MITGHTSSIGGLQLPPAGRQRSSVNFAVIGSLSTVIVKCADWPIGFLPASPYSSHSSYGPEAPVVHSNSRWSGKRSAGMTTGYQPSASGVTTNGLGLTTIGQSVQLLPVKMPVVPPYL